MSGIAGIIHFDGKPVEPGLIEKMTSAMAHRGPDGIHHWVKGSVALGQCMLRTTPESLEEHQPLTNEDESLVLVMDGRVDNWEELRGELLGRGAVLRTCADAELVLRAYEIWGRDCLTHIDGDFALVIWDTQRREAFCARDRMGHKPLNYHWHENTFVFASELHTILALPWVPAVPNEGMLAEFLAADWYSNSETFWSGVSRLPAAYGLNVHQSGLRISRYWDPDLCRMLDRVTDDECVTTYKALFDDIVRRQCRSCSTVACEVSGGLDSSAVFCTAERLRRSAELPAPTLRGFTLAFAGEQDADELEFCRSITNFLGVEVNEIPPTTVPLEWFHHYAHAYREFPGYPNGVMSLGLRRQAAAEGCRVILSGAGGDEWVGSEGRRFYYAEELASFRGQNLVDSFLADLMAAGLGPALFWFARDGMLPLFPGFCTDFLVKLRRRMSHQRKNAEIFGSIPLSPSLRYKLAGRRVESQAMHTTPVRRLGQVRQCANLNDAFIAWAIEHEERMAANCGLELRHPMRNWRLVQFALSTTERSRRRGSVNKYTHRRAMETTLPRRVLERKTKAEFSVVFRRQLEGVGQEHFRQLVNRRDGWFGDTPSGRSGDFSKQEIADQLAANVSAVQWRAWGALGCDLLFEGRQALRPNAV